jgi:nucleotide-binding universal stress UspA family protein
LQTSVHGDNVPNHAAQRAIVPVVAPVNRRSAAMLSTLLVPLDGSPLAERALPYAEDLARRANGRLVLTRAVEGDADNAPDERQTAALADADAYLQTITENFGTRGMAAQHSTPFGDIDEQIAAEAENRSVDMIVMATHGRDGLARLFSGSVAEEVLHHTTRPIMFIRADDDATTPAAPLPTGARVLVPLDGTPFSETALEPACELARLLEGEVMLLSVISPPPPPAMSELTFAAAPYVDFDLNEAQRESQAYLGRVAQQHGIDPARANATVQYGGTADGIAEAIEKSGAAVVVMATHARSGLGRLIFGSTATDTLHHITVPLVLMRVEDDAELAGSEQQIETAQPNPLAATAVNVA